MLATDITVEVRDKTLRRLGKIPDQLVKLTGTIVHNGVGSWSLDLPAEDPMTAVLRRPGAGIIVTGPTGVLWSGPMTKTSVKTDAGDPRGLVTISGVTDDVLLSDATAWPQPSNGDLTTQALAYDNRSGAAETIMRQYVSVNIGPGAPASRRSFHAQKLTLAPDLGRGPTVVKSARFPVLGELLAEIATVAGLGFQVIQRGDVLVFEVTAIVDRTKFVRLDVANGGLASQTVEISAPGATVPIVLGQGQGEERTIVTRTNATALAAEAAWGRKPEVVKDQRNTDVLVELQQAGDTILAEKGFAATNTKAIPAASTGMQYAIDWNVGDKITVVVDGQEASSTATQATIMAGPDGMLVGVGIGDLRGFDATASLAGRVDDTETRVSQLERNAEASVSSRAWAPIVPMTGWVALADPYRLPSLSSMDGIVHLKSGIFGRAPSGMTTVSAGVLYQLSSPIAAGLRPTDAYAQAVGTLNAVGALVPVQVRVSNSGALGFIPFDSATLDANSFVAFSALFWPAP